MTMLVDTSILVYGAEENSPHHKSEGELIAEFKNSILNSLPTFKSKKELAAYEGLVPKQNQSANHDLKRHLTKHEPYMLRFITVNAAHSVIKFSRATKSEYNNIVRRLGDNRAIVAIARHFLAVVYTMLFKRQIEGLHTCHQDQETLNGSPIANKRIERTNKSVKRGRPSEG